MPRSMPARSLLPMMPQAASMRAWASEAAMSCSARRWSNATEAVKRLTSSSTGSREPRDQDRAGLRG